MRETITGRNPVYECLRAKRRDVFRLQIAEGVHERGRLIEILELSSLRKIPIEHVPRARLDKLSDSHQGVALEVSGYPYVGLDDILENAGVHGEALFVLVLDTLQNPQNLGTLIRTAESVGGSGGACVLVHVGEGVGEAAAAGLATAPVIIKEMQAMANKTRTIDSPK